MTWRLLRRHATKRACIPVLLSLLWLQAGGSALAADGDLVRVALTPVQGGAELITWFEQLPATATNSGVTEMPILSVLNDTLAGAEPGEERLRQVWVYTYAPPSLAQRAESAVPFLYRRLWSDSDSSSKPPHAAFDMGAPANGLWLHLAMATVQAEVVNPEGAIARLTTRSYGGNLGEYKTTHIWEALDLLPPAAAGTNEDGVTTDEYQLLQSRMELTGRMFSGLVGDDALPEFYRKNEIERTEIRGHNWELLRQTAEDNGLQFQPLEIGGRGNAFAMVWVAPDDLGCGTQARRDDHFDSQFLKIPNPFTDAHLCQWKGYSQIWNRDGKQTRMIPLALYALDYPGVPLLLVDFRRSGGPTRAEMTLRLSDDVATGVFGFTGFGSLTHLGYQAAKAGWMFVHTRHGSATNRSMRRREFVELRHALAVDTTLDPALRKQLASRLEKLDIDPLERTWNQEVRGAWAQYDALMKYAGDPGGLARVVIADREQEARAMAHGPAARALLQAASISTFGLYRHREHLTPETMAEIAETRRGAARADATRTDSTARETVDSEVLRPVAFPVVPAQTVAAGAR